MRGQVEGLGSPEALRCGTWLLPLAPLQSCTWKVESELGVRFWLVKNYEVGLGLVYEVGLWVGMWLFLQLGSFKRGLGSLTGLLVDAMQV